MAVLTPINLSHKKFSMQTTMAYIACYKSIPWPFLYHFTSAFMELANEFANCSSFVKSLIVKHNLQKWIISTAL